MRVWVGFASPINAHEPVASRAEPLCMVSSVVLDIEVIVLTG